MEKFIDLDPNNFRESILIIDIDGTLVADGSRSIRKNVTEKMEELKKTNEVYISSNGKNLEFFSSVLNLSPIFCHKPFVGSAKKLKEGDKNITVVGDKYLTDGLFAKALGAAFVKVNHLYSGEESLLTKVFYLIDDIVWKAIAFLSLIRAFQWIKNLLVFAPIFFAEAIFDKMAITQTLWAFGSFCFASSFVYIWNDILDKALDQLHPKKKNRPFASGSITDQQAYGSMVVLLILTVACFSFVPQIIWTILTYIFLNGLYSVWLKHVAVVDVLCVAIFYILRIITGGLSAHVYVSPWIILCVLFGALFVVVGKRRGEYRCEVRRKVLDEYSEEALDFMLSASIALSIITYAIWSIVAHQNAPLLVYSTIFVLLAMFRMLNRIYSCTFEAESPETLVFKDRWILLSFVFWVVYVFIVFYFI